LLRNGCRIKLFIIHINLWKFHYQLINMYYFCSIIMIICLLKYNTRIKYKIGWSVSVSTHGLPLMELFVFFPRMRILFRLIKWFPRYRCKRIRDNNRTWCIINVRWFILSFNSSKYISVLYNCCLQTLYLFTVARNHLQSFHMFILTLLLLLR
jgi:hypothetical protein